MAPFEIFRDNARPAQYGGKSLTAAVASGTDRDNGSRKRGHQPGELVGVNLGLGKRSAAGDQPWVGQNALDFAQTWREAKVQPDRIANHAVGKVMAFQAGRSGRQYHQPKRAAPMARGKPDSAAPDTKAVLQS